MKKYFKGLLSASGLRLSRDTPSSHAEFVLQANLEMVLLPVIRRLGREFFFVEIGANDGCSTDPLHPLVREFGLRGLLVEPQPDVFERLRKTYADADGLVFENAAVAAKGGTMTLYRLKPDYGKVAGVRRPDFDTRVTSLDPKLVLQHIGYAGPADDILETVEVPALAPAELLARHHVGAVSLLQIDTEGADWDILQAWDWEEHPPLVVAYEHLHLGVENFERSIAFLTERGYAWSKGAWDVIAVHREPYGRLLERPVDS